MAAAFAAGETEKADGPLHEAGHLLEAMAKFAESESFSAADLTAVKAATEELLDLLGEVDDRVHGGETKGKAFSEVAAQVTDALARLRAIKTPEEKS